MIKKSAILTSVLLTSHQVAAMPIDLTGVGYVTYGDFNSYSLPIAQIQDGCTGPGCDYHVASSPGQISDLIVIATGTNNGPVNTNFAGMDNAYRTPSGQGDPNYFQTSVEPDPGEVSAFSGDQADTWDASLLSLRNFLMGDDMVFFFNNNNLNGANEQSLAVWAQVEITDENGLSLGIFDFTNDGGAYALVSEGGGGDFLGDPTSYTSDGSGPLIGDNSSTDYVLAGGPICIDTDPAIPVPVSCSNPDADDGPINHNLGADEVAYAVIAPELNDLMDSLFGLADPLLDQYTLHMDLRMGCDPLFGMENDEICTGLESGFGKNMNNGYEQLFIGRAVGEGNEIPAPSPLLLSLMSLLALRLKRK